MDKRERKIGVDLYQRTMVSFCGGIKMSDWKLVSESEPGSNYCNTGQMWIKPSIGQAYLRIGNNWTPFASGAAVQYEHSPTVMIRGLNKTEKTVGNFQKQDLLTSQIDSCSFGYEDIDGGYKPEKGDEVFWFYREEETDTPVKIFSGRIESAPQELINEAIKKYRYNVRCVDYSADLNKRMVVESYTNKTCAYIINDLINNYATDFSTHNVQTGFTVNFISWNYKPISECIKELCDLSGGLYDYYVDEDRDIHFFQKETNDAPYELNETTETGAMYHALNIEIDKSQLRNRVFVRGGYYLSNNFTQEIVADGEQKEFLLAYPPRTAAGGAIEVYVNDVQKTLGTDFLHISGYDFVVNYVEKLIKNLDLAALSAGDVLKVIYRYDVPILVRNDDEASQADVRLIEGGNGVYEMQPIVDASISTLEQARVRAAAELLKYSVPIVSGDFITNKYGYRSGQYLTINLPSRGINDIYMIVEVITYTVGNMMEYQVFFASKRSKGLTELLVELIDKKNEIITREDEVLQELCKVSDSVGITETALNYSEPTGIWDTDKWDEFEWN